MGALFDLADGPEAQLLQVWWSSLRPSSSRMRGLDPIPTTSQLTCERLSNFIVYGSELTCKNGG
jgi:hypothetical protein